MRKTGYTIAKIYQVYVCILCMVAPCLSFGKMHEGFAWLQMTNGAQNSPWCIQSQRERESSDCLFVYFRCCFATCCLHVEQVTAQIVAYRAVLYCAQAVPTQLSLRTSFSTFHFIWKEPIKCQRTAASTMFTTFFPVISYRQQVGLSRIRAGLASVQACGK